MFFLLDGAFVVANIVNYTTIFSQIGSKEMD